MLLTQTEINKLNLYKEHRRKNLNCVPVRIFLNSVLRDDIEELEEYVVESVY